MPTSGKTLRSWLLGACILLLAAGLGAQDAAPDYFTIHYHRDLADYAGWGLHVWGMDLKLDQAVTWGNPLMPVGRDDFGIIWKVGLKPSAATVNFIIHLGERKNTPSDVVAFTATNGYEIWVLQGNPSIYSNRPRLSTDPEPSPTAIPPSPTPAASPAAPVVAVQADIPSGSAALRKAAAASKAISDELEALKAEKMTLQERLDSLETDLAEEQGLRLDSERKAGILGLAGIAIGLGFICGWIFVGILLSRRASDRKKLAAKSRELAAETESKLLQKSIQDELTGLTNRAGLNQALPLALTKARRYKRQVALIYIDLDNFKPINDSLGHDAGDYVLATIAERFKACIRESDLICRLGGDEFIILVEDLVDARYVGGIAQKLLSASQQGFSIGGHEVHVSASIGIAIYPQDGRDPSSLVKNADEAMYEAKEHGRNNYHYFSAEQNIHALQRQALAANLGRALERKEFSLAFLPVIDATDGQIATVDVLARWKAQDLDSIPPIQFIPLAEETGTIRELGLWILYAALQQARKWRNSGRATGISLNISTRQLYQEGFIEDVTKALEEFDFPARDLTFEFTEDCIAVNPDEALELLQSLKDLGIRILLDDFGIGLASLVNLKRYPIDALKLDRSLAADIPGDEENEKMSSAVLSIGKELGIATIACGMESTEQKAHFVESGWRFIQGFIHGTPMDAEEMTARLGL